MAKPGATVSRLPVQAKLVGQGLIEDSLNLTLDRFRVGIHGPPGVGKTFAALTASKYWPDELPAKKMVNLSDVLHICWDANANTGLAEQNIRVPTIAIAKLMTPSKSGSTRPFAKSILDALTMVIKDAHAWVEANKDKEGEVTIVNDTISTLNSDVDQYWDDNCPMSKNGFKDTRAKWQCVFNTHKRYHQAMRFIEANLIFNFHSKAIIETDSKEGQDQAKKTRAAGLADISIDVTGKSSNLYLADLSGLFWMIAKKSPTGKTQRLLKVDAGEVLVKNRWQGSLSGEEEANFQKIFAKVRRNMQKG